MWMLALLFGCPKADDISTDELPLDPCGSADLARQPVPAMSTAGMVAAVDLVEVAAVAYPSADAIDFQATATFVASDVDGLSVLEFHPDIVMASIDGQPVELAVAEVGAPAREVLVLGDFEACSQHTLTVSYTVEPGYRQDIGSQERFSRKGDGLWWAAALEDAKPGQFLGMWMPSNLLFDRFDATLFIDDSQVAGHTLLHSAIEVGREESASYGLPVLDSGWALLFSNVQAHAPFWVLSPVEMTEIQSRSVSLRQGTVQVEARHLLDGTGGDLARVLDQAEANLQALDADFGDYKHGEGYQIFIRNDQASSMEYDGATLTAEGALFHEITHSWFARGISPRADRDGWLDEAITSWISEFYELPVPLDVEAAGPTDMYIGEDDWAGADLSVEPYLVGGFLFAGIADRHGVDSLKDALKQMFLTFGDVPYASADVEQFLTCWFDDDHIRWFFSTQAYGIDGPVPPRPAGWCEG